MSHSKQIQIVGDDLSEHGEITTQKGGVDPRPRLTAEMRSMSNNSWLSVRSADLQTSKLSTEFSSPQLSSIDSAEDLVATPDGATTLIDPRLQLSLPDTPSNLTPILSPISQRSESDLIPQNSFVSEPESGKQIGTVDRDSAATIPTITQLRQEIQQERSSGNVEYESSILQPEFVSRAAERPLKGHVQAPDSESDVGRLDEPTVAIAAQVQTPEVVEDDIIAPVEPLLVTKVVSHQTAHQLLLTNMEKTVVTAVPKVRPDQTDTSLRDKGRRKITLQKHAMQASQCAINGFFIFATWWWSHYYYILLPFITSTVALNVIMVLDVVIAKVKHHFLPEQVVIPETPEALVFVVPCYNETKEELLKSINSLCSQTSLEKHLKTIMIICDGKVRGPGMKKTTADYLLEDILVHRSERKVLKAAYIAWDQQYMDIVIQKGEYRGIPYLCVIKEQNQGKRDSLIVIRSFLYNFNIRDKGPTVIFSTTFFAEMAAWLLELGFDRVDKLIGMDADTSFEPDCIWNLIQESRYPKTVGVCGYVTVDYTAGNWGIWRLYQSAEYTIAQSLRRLHQSTVTKKVSCLPGCVQLLKICEETCGPEVLIEKFGYCPVVNDGLLKHIRATASEDRNHVCNMLSARPSSETRQALGARASTDVPHSWSVFLSQRRRWTLGATSNDLFLTFAPGVQWFERILAAVNVVTWFLNPFILASLAGFILACTNVAAWIIMCFVGVMLIPITYYLCVPFWLCRNVRESLQFWVGCACYIFLGPFLNISVLLYACWKMDSFGWGKTRKVLSEENSSDQKTGRFNEVVRGENVVPRDVESQERLDSDRVRQTVDEEKMIGM